ncbi:MAG: nucleoside 2-deoxyribosyltransferase [Ignavibacteria bacterium]|nr:nucleoside 2-deoxyribosyltransferase [Ignavibacteria bacterium]
MKIYFATSISGVITEDSNYNNIELIKILKEYGTVLSEHFANADIQSIGEKELSDQFIHDRDMGWIDESDSIVADVTNPSLGVGYEIRHGIVTGKKILCLKRKNGKRLSAMITGNGKVTVKEYTDIEEAKNIIGGFFSS